ncbi:DEAD/DEAH box helicase [Robinsoniella peoriensis]|uniref:DEAD/DEAH box helicase n=1 Tax=Robinsoniella peoriensis TaxID=180332 RepID=UPI0005C7DFF1|nr:DEAD/DEAH box helicase [Robinsoniella peoriensis]
MNYEPHEYQEYAKEFIISQNASALFLDCGLGKTVITLSAIWELLLDYFEVKKVLVIAPLRVARDTWPGELGKWDHLAGIEMSGVLGSVEDRIKALARRANVYVINRENVEWLVEECKWDFDMVVLDELSSFKSHKAKRFKGLKKVRPMVKRIVGLTGTPAPNGLIDLWAEIGILDMGQRLGRFIGGYQERFFLPDKRSREIIYSYKPREGAEEAIYNLLSDICISMKAADYLDMPGCVYNLVEVFMTDKELKLYRQLERDMLIPYEDGDIDAVNAAGLSNKLMQMANGAVYDENGTVKRIHDRKLEMLEDLVEAANGKPVLISYWYKHDLERIKERIGALELDTAEDMKEWNAGEIPVAVIHPASAGHGLNLQAGGSTLVWFGLTWSLELYQQMNARLWRQGQKQTVVIHHLITKGTLDERVMEALEKKECGQSALVEAVKARIGGIRDGCGKVV